MRSELDARGVQANAILDGSIPAGEADARFVILGRQEIQGTSDCDQSYPREDDPAGRLRAAGWQVAFESASMTIFSLPDDPVLTGFH
jgi:hypothetical protein